VVSAADQAILGGLAKSTSTETIHIRRKHEEFLADWTALRLIMRHVERKLAEQYKLVPLE
jgi:hypothetical protein